MCACEEAREGSLDGLGKGIAMPLLARATGSGTGTGGGGQMASSPGEGLAALFPEALGGCLSSSAGEEELWESWVSNR